MYYCIYRNVVALKPCCEAASILRLPEEATTWFLCLCLCPGRFCWKDPSSLF